MTHSNKTHGYLPVLAALLGNTFVMVMKFAGFFISGSGALFSEAIHSIADVFNQILLMVGVKRSTKKADNEYSYGYGKERFFWAVISACSIFFLGAGVTINYGIQRLMHKQTIHLDYIVFTILIISFIVELFTFFIAIKELKQHNPGEKLSEILNSGDPSTLAVVYEDGVALLGVLIALGSTILTKITGQLYWDAFGSICIGVLLGLVAIILVNKNRGFLVGKNMPGELEEEIIDILESDPTIEKVFDFKSIVLDVNKYLIKCEVEFNSPSLLREKYKFDFKNEYEEVKDDYEEFKKFCVDHTDRIPRLIGLKIDEIEKKIKEKAPEVEHIDIEIN